jgi:hypothetical protein
LFAVSVSRILFSKKTYELSNTSFLHKDQDKYTLNQSLLKEMAIVYNHLSIHQYQVGGNIKSLGKSKINTFFIVFLKA